MEEEKFEFTPRQIQALDKLSGPKKHVLLFGGSRSAKTFIICWSMIARACKTKSRHAALRLKFNHAKTSLFYDTFPKVFKLAFPDLPYTENRSDWFFGLPNGSEIWVGGLDEKKRVEKILGKEYSTLFFNESSQIPLTSVNVALTRLAEKNFLKKRVYYDENPPTKKHWSYPLFIKGFDPETWEPKKNAHEYDSMLMNPQDNLANIDPDYISLLESLPEDQRKRFLSGEFGEDSGGQIYYAFDREQHVKEAPTDVAQLPVVFAMDFNVSPGTMLMCRMTSDTIYVIDELWKENSNTPEMGRAGLAKFPGKHILIPDSTGKNRSTAAPMSAQSDIEQLKQLGFTIPHVRNPFRVDRYNNVNNLFEKGKLFIDPKCVKLIKDLEAVAYKEGTNMPDTTDKSLGHITDALGYVTSWAFPIIQIETGVGMIPR